MLGNTAAKNKPANLIRLIVNKENPASCKRSNLVSIKPVNTIEILINTAICDLFI